MDRFTHFASDGSVDVSASVAAYTEALSQWEGANQLPSTEVIEAAVEAVFDRFEGQRLPMPALLSYAVTEVGVEPRQHKALTQRVHAYLSGQSADNTGRIDIGRGKVGGVARLSRPGEAIPERPSKKSSQ